MTNQKDRLLGEKESSQAVIDAGNKYTASEAICRAQDAKSVKARDKEWVEWFEGKMVFIEKAFIHSIMMCKDNKGVWEFIIEDSDWQALKRSIDDDKTK